MRQIWQLSFFFAISLTDGEPFIQLLLVPVWQDLMITIYRMRIASPATTPSSQQQLFGAQLCSWEKPRKATKKVHLSPCLERAANIVVLVKFFMNKIISLLSLGPLVPLLYRAGWLTGWPVSFFSWKCMTASWIGVHFFNAALLVRYFVVNKHICTSDERTEAGSTRPWV